MKDFLGNKLKVGDYVTRPGSGRAEGGLVLYKLVEIRDRFIVGLRLDTLCSFDKGVSGKRTAYIKKGRLRKATTILRVEPHPNQVKLFEHHEKNADLVSKWIHGSININWDKAKIEVK